MRSATDKVETEMAAPAGGVLARIVAGVGETVAVGALLAELSVGDAEVEAGVEAIVPRGTGAGRGPGAL